MSNFDRQRNKPNSSYRLSSELNQQLSGMVETRNS